ncbi:MAG: wax ester/triacylglycerol synthase family O-acyltransferase [Deltaproteobacteria bacterium]|nr:wax ester/triacylglycerol synthase family O-acyltransferase [Deltaproteobacteria bacterium]
MRRLSPNDAMFLFGESRETMMHVGSLMPFTPPDDAPPDFLRGLIDELRESRTLHPPWNLKLKTPNWLKNPFPAWIEDPAPDIDYHVRRSALPSPGDERELGVLVSRLHSIAVDFTRPPWEVHLIEGLERGRFALYTKMHHALIDGFTGNRILARSLSRDPADRTMPLFFALPEPAREREERLQTSPWEQAWSSAQTQIDAAKEVANTIAEIWKGRRAGDADMEKLRAPHSILNGRIGRNRRFATQAYDLEHVKALARSAGGTLNDIVLALCAGALRRFLKELGALPDAPLVAMLPVNVRPKDDPGGGNAVGAMLVSLATDRDSPLDRLETIIHSTRVSKERLQGMSRQAVIQFSALLMAPSGVQTVTGTLGRVRPQFNVCISNVPGPDYPLYFRGARLEAVYPMSIPIHGQALNITCQSYNGMLDFGFIGCRDTLPHMQRLAVYTGEALAEIEGALAARSI